MSEGFRTPIPVYGFGSVTATVIGFRTPIPIPFGGVVAGAGTVGFRMFPWFQGGTDGTTPDVTRDGPYFIANMGKLMNR